MRVGLDGLWRPDRRLVFCPGIGRALGGSATDPVRCLLAGILLDVDHVFVGGRFTIAGGESSLNIGHYVKPGGRTKDPDDGTATPNGISSAPVAGESRSSGFALGSIAPNPAVADATLSLTLGRAGTVAVRIFSTLGVEIARPFNGVLGAGRQTIALPLADLPRGIYLVSVVSEEGTAEARIVVGE